MQTQILVPYDFGPASQRALAWVADLQRMLGGAPVHVLHVLDQTPFVSFDTFIPTLMEDATEDTRDRLKQAIRDHGLTATAEVVLASSVGSAILSETARLPANLIVMGTHGRTGLRRAALGSVAEHVVRHASCPVVTVRGAPADDSPARAA